MLCDVPMLGVETEFGSIKGRGDLWSFLLEAETKSYHLGMFICGSYY